MRRVKESMPMVKHDQIYFISNHGGIVHFAVTFGK